MRSVRPLLVVPGAILALLAGACGDATEVPVATRADLAAEVDRVADLIEDEQPCQALEVVRLLEVLATQASDDQARAAVDRFTAGVRSSVTCDPGDLDEDDLDDEVDDSDDEVDDSDDDRRGPPPGRGRGRGN